MRRVIVVLPLLVVLAGCAGASGGSGSSAALSRPADGVKDAAVAGAPVQPAVDSTKAVQVPRSLIRTATLQVRVRDVKRAATAAETLVRDVGGEVSDEQLDLKTADPTASMELRVPPLRLAATLTRLGGLGDEQARRLGTEDVTDQAIDLESRLVTQRTSVTRVRALLDRASSLTDVVRIEAELSRREADLESLQARVRALSGQVEMAVVTLSLTSRPEPAVASSVGFTRGLHGGWDAFTAAARVTAAAVGALLPFLPLLVAVIWGAVWWRRRTSTA
jgi:hypothetical protein